MKILVLSFEDGNHYLFGRRKIDAGLGTNHYVEHLLIKRDLKFINRINFFKIIQKLGKLIRKGKLKAFIFHKLDYIINYKLITNFNKVFNSNIENSFLSLNRNIRSEKKESITGNVNEYLSKLSDNEFDLLLVLGAPYLKEFILDKFTYKLNLHLGYLPYYKGVRSIECALINRELDKIGYTIHYLNAKIDGGKILYRERLEMNSINSISEIYTKCFFKGFYKIVDIVKNIESYKAIKNTKGSTFDTYYFSSKRYKRLIELGYKP